MQGFDKNRIWCAPGMLACELIAFNQMLAFTNTPTRRREPNGYFTARYGIRSNTAT